MLLMKKEFFDAIRTGTKTTTLRYWLRQMVKAGQVHSVRGLGHVKIEQILPVQLDELSQADALADGFTSLEQLLAVLDSIYPPEKRLGRRLYRITFSYLPRRL
jgi:hypothetical protein